MCILCIEFQKGKMDIREAKNNLRELLLTSEDLTLEEMDHLDALNWAENMVEEMYKFEETDENRT